MGEGAEEWIPVLEWAIEQELDDKLFRRWIVQAQFEMSFDEYKAQFDKTEKSEEEIMKDVEVILRGII